MQKKLYKSVTDRKVFGVCGGLGEYFNIDASIVRLIFVFLVLCVGTGLLAYRGCGLVLDDDPNPYHKQVSRNPYDGAIDNSGYGDFVRNDEYRQ